MPVASAQIRNVLLKADLNWCCIMPAGQLLSAVEEGTQGSRDVARLCAAAGVLTQIVTARDDDSSLRGSLPAPSVPHRALTAVLKMLSSPFPKVGTHACFLTVVFTLNHGRLSIRSRLIG